MTLLFVMYDHSMVGMETISTCKTVNHRRNLDFWLAEVISSRHMIKRYGEYLDSLLICYIGAHIKPNNLFFHD